MGCIALTEDEDDLNGEDDDEDDDVCDDNLHEASVHVKPAVVDSTIVVVLKAHVEQDDKSWHAPPHLKVNFLKSTKLADSAFSSKIIGGNSPTFASSTCTQSTC